MNQSSSGSMVQIPVDVLQSLVTSIDALRHEVVNLRQERLTLQFQTPNPATPASTITTQSEVPRDDTTEEYGKTFQCFNKLPPEMRDAIWRVAAKAPRVVTAKIAPRSGLESSDTVYAPNALPFMLSVSKEPRKVALEVYTCFTDPETRLPRLYMQPDIDTMLLLNRDLNRVFQGKARKMWRKTPKFKHLALDWKFCHELFLHANDYRVIQGMFNVLAITGVEVVSIVLGDIDESVENVDFGSPRGCPEDLRCCNLQAFLLARRGKAVGECSWRTIVFLISEYMQAILDRNLSAGRITASMSSLCSSC